jgi:hypothetical protein
MGSNQRSEARRRIAERLRRFVNFLMARLTTSSDELMRRAEAKHAAETQQADAEPKARTGL